MGGPGERELGGHRTMTLLLYIIITHTIHRDSITAS